MGKPAKLTTPVVTTRGVLVDALPPSVTGPTLLTAGSYKTGQTLKFTARFSEPVTVTGTPKLQVVIGTTVWNLAYIRGSGTNALVFSYTPLAANKDANVIALQPQIVLGCGMITDKGGTPTSFTLPGVDTSGITVG